MVNKQSVMMITEKDNDDNEGLGGIVWVIFLDMFSKDSKNGTLGHNGRVGQL